jgi:hypothetical protein
MTTHDADRFQEQLREQLRQTIQSLDTALAQVTPLDDKLRAALTRMYTKRDDELGSLLAEVSQKASILDVARMRAAVFARTPHVDASQLTSNSVIAVRASHAEQGEQESFADVGVGLPQSIEHSSITIGVDSLSVSTWHLRIGLRLSSGAPFSVDAAALPGTEALPLLTGVQVSDESGVHYALELPAEVATTGDPAQSFSSALRFSPAPAQAVRRLRLTIASVLFAHREAFFAMPSTARLVEGPWQFDIALRAAG